MKRTIRLAIIIALISVILLVSGCGGVNEENLSNAIKARDVNTMVELITQASEQDNKDEMYSIVADEFKDLCKSTDWNDYVFMDKIIKKTKDKSLKKQLKQVIKENGDNKVIAFTKGEWVRRDYTDMDGMVINVKWNDKDGAAIVTSLKNARNNEYAFKKGDIKWKDIKILSSNEFVYSDLEKNTDYTDYKDSYATINYNFNQIKIKVTNAGGSDYDLGNTQVWIKKDAINKKKEKLKKRDFTKAFGIKLSEIEDDTYYLVYDKTFVPNKELRKKVKDDGNKSFARNIKFGDSRRKVIRAFGYGHVMYQSYKNEPYYKLTEGENLDFVNKGFRLLLTKSKYSVLYYNKEDGAIIKMFFNRDNKIMGAYTLKNYDSWVKAANQ